MAAGQLATSLEGPAGGRHPPGQVGRIAQTAERRRLVRRRIRLARVLERALVRTLAARQITGDEQQVAAQVLQRGPRAVVVGRRERIGLVHAHQRLVVTVQQAQRRRQAQPGSRLLLGRAGLAFGPGEHRV